MHGSVGFDPSRAANPNCSCIGGIIPQDRRGIMGHIVRGNVLCACTGAHGPTAKRAQNIKVGTLRPLWAKGA
jgi:hypothetical protein